MTISTKGRYGLEALMVLCLESENKHVSLKKIAESCNLSEAYILQIFLVLRRSGIVESVRGAQGGYFLAKDPSHITVGEVLSVLEGPLSPVHCIFDRKECSRSEGCVTRVLWEKIAKRLNEIAASITLSELVEYYQSLNPTIYEDYCI